MFDVPPGLKRLEASPEGREWLYLLPTLVNACADRWSLRLGRPYNRSQFSIVFPATTADQSAAVLKVQFPHSECKHEAEALRHWNGHGAVRLFESDSQLHALLIERCDPGDHLSALEPDAALEVIAELLPRLWIPASEPFISLRDESAGWAEHLASCWERAGRLRSNCSTSRCRLSIPFGTVKGSKSSCIRIFMEITCCVPRANPGS